MSGSSGIELQIFGRVQGVGFRPFVYRLATQLALTGEVWNTGAHVVVTAWGPAQQIDQFQHQLRHSSPPTARIERIVSRPLPPLSVDQAGSPSRQRFSIAASRLEEGTAKHLLPLPDLALCDDCRREVLDPTNRRFGYALISCPHCGPRYTICQRTPFDRPHTSMAAFPLCRRCHEEFTAPENRRFHAQAIACPECGPRLQLVTPRRPATDATTAADPIDEAAAALARGAIVALKGLGGYQLLADATNGAAIGELRHRKGRPEKPLALMVRELAELAGSLTIHPEEVTAFTSAEAPIVLFAGRTDRPVAAKTDPAPVADAVAPGLAMRGVMRPTTAIHLLLLERLRRPLVVTSGNLSGEPLAIDDEEALHRLRSVADLFLQHNRPIWQGADDSVVRRIDGQIVVLRGGRGLAPSLHPHPDLRGGALALGAHGKNRIAFSFDRQLVLSPHIGDLDTCAAWQRAEQVEQALSTLYDARSTRVLHDKHPDGATEARATPSGLPRRAVPHHLAHVLAAIVASGRQEPVWGVAWDGTGYGEDGTIWGGEILWVAPTGWQRVATLRPFRLPGGEAAIREPRRSALGLVAAYRGLESTERWFRHRALFRPRERDLLLQAIARGLNAPWTTSGGRLFDAWAALCGLAAEATYEGQAALRLEEAATRALRTHRTEATLDLATLEPLAHFAIRRPGSLGELDLAPLLDHHFAASEGACLDAEQAALALHVSLAVGLRDLLEQLRRTPDARGEPWATTRTVVLTGGLFQNALLGRLARDGLQQANFSPYLPTLIPPNDGGIAAGQALHDAWYQS